MGSYYGTSKEFSSLSDGGVFYHAIEIKIFEKFVARLKRENYRDNVAIGATLSCT